MKKGFLILAFLGGPLGAEPLKLTLNLSVAGEESAAQNPDLSHPPAEPFPFKRLPLIPTRVEILRRVSDDFTFTDPSLLSRAYATVHLEHLFDARLEDGKPQPTNRSRLVNFRKNIEGLKVSRVLSEDQRRDIRLRGSAYNVFQNYEINLLYPLISNLCSIDFEQNAADCGFKFPAIQPLGRKPTNISYVKLRVFIQGEISNTDLSRLPSEILEKRDDFLAENSRQTQFIDDQKEKMDGYFLYANYHFDAATEEADCETPNAKKYEWRFALSQVQGRLALIAGNYLIEREIKFSDDKTVLEQAKISLDWNQLMVDDPMAEKGQFIEWRELSAPTSATNP